MGVTECLVTSQIDPNFSIINVVFSFYTRGFSSLSRLLRGVVRLSCASFLARAAFFIVTKITFFLEWTCAMRDILCFV